MTLPRSAGPTEPDCVFCAIVAGDAPAHLVWRDHAVVAFLDRTPLFAGHTLVVPVGHHVTLGDLPADQVGHYFDRVQFLSRVIQLGADAAGSFVAMNNVVSQSVPHLHTHVVPRNRGDGLKGFFWPRRRYPSDDDAAEVAERLRATADALSP